jgi:hypothetical protein
MTVHPGATKTDQAGDGAVIGVPYGASSHFSRRELTVAVFRMKRAAVIAQYIAALAAIAAWLVFTPDPPRHCSYSPVLNSCT